jgi:hypothetical protein
MAEPVEAMAIPQHLAKAKAELSFFILVSDALDEWGPRRAQLGSQPSDP